MKYANIESRLIYKSAKDTLAPPEKWFCYVITHVILDCTASLFVSTFDIYTVLYGKLFDVDFVRFTIRHTCKHTLKRHISAPVHKRSGAII